MRDSLGFNNLPRPLVVSLPLWPPRPRRSFSRWPDVIVTRSDGVWLWTWSGDERSDISWNDTHDVTLMNFYAVKSAAWPRNPLALARAALSMCRSNILDSCANWISAGVFSAFRTFLASWGKSVQNGDAKPHRSWSPWFMISDTDPWYTLRSRGLVYVATLKWPCDEGYQSKQSRNPIFSPTIKLDRFLASDKHGLQFIFTFI